MSDIDLLEVVSRPRASSATRPAAQTAAAVARKPARGPTLDGDDALRPVRGIACAMLLAVPFWAATGSTLWALLR